MIERAVELRNSVEGFIGLVDGKARVDPTVISVPLADRLTSDDWKLLAEMQQVLQHIYKQTMSTQGHGVNGTSGCLWEVLANLELLLDRLEQLKVQYAVPREGEEGFQAPVEDQVMPRRRRPLRQREEDLPEHARPHYTTLPNPDPSGSFRAFIATSINLCWSKLDEYYTKTTDSPLYAAALILHPRFNISCLERTWADNPEWVDNACCQFRRWFKDHYDTDGGDDDEPMPAPAIHQPMNAEDTELESFLLGPSTRTPPRECEIDRYFEVAKKQGGDVKKPLEWWIARRAEFPCLSRFAFDMLAIPAMAAENERVFSLAKLVMSTQRQSMSDETLDQLMCLKMWLRQNIISLAGPVGLKPGDFEISRVDDDESDHSDVLTV